MVVNLLKYLANKPSSYTLIWVHIITESKGGSSDLNSLYVCSKFGVSRTSFRRIVDYGCDKFDLDRKWTRNELSIKGLHDSVGQKVDSKASSKIQQITDEVVEYLNKRIDGRYNSKTKATIKLVSSRVNEGYVSDDFKDVIDYLAEEWLNDSKMSKFLRPSTMFSPKFNEYLSNSHSPHRNNKTIKQTKNDKFNDAALRASTLSF